MIKKLAYLLGNIVERIKKRMPELYAGLGGLAVSLAITLVAIALGLNRFDNKFFWMATIMIVVGVASLIYAAILVSKRERQQQKRDDALLINIMALGSKLGVTPADLKKARDIVERIDKI